MRALLLTITTSMFITSAAHAQTDVHKLTDKLTEVFTKTKAIKEIASNKKTVLGQLQDIKLWQENGLLSSELETELEISYTEYANAMNMIAEEVSEDISTLSTFKAVKSSRLDKFISGFETKYQEDIFNAHSIYQNDFFPKFQTAAEKASSKGGIVGSILLILEFGDTIFSAIKSIFTSEGLSRKSKDTLVEMAISLVSKKITKQLSYPSWQEVGISSNSLTIDSVNSFTETTRQTSFGNTMKSNNSESSTRSPNAPMYTTNEVSSNQFNEINEISLLHFDTNKTIRLQNNTKGIIVGNSFESNTDISLFITETPIHAGDRFWVTMSGKYHAQFYYYDEHSSTWEDPFGKGIIVGTEDTPEHSTLKLPSEKSFFEITGNSDAEQFFILVSTKKIPDVIKTGIHGGKVTGVTFLESLNKLIPLNYPTVNKDKGTLTITPTLASQSPDFFGIYITLEKNVNQ